jgi:hypothetical protein
MCVGSDSGSTWKLKRSLEVIKDKLGEDAESMVVLEQDQLGSIFNRPESLRYSSQLLILAHVHLQLPGVRIGINELTRRFFSAMNTLGVDTTPMVELDDAPSRS